MKVSAQFYSLYTNQVVIVTFFDYDVMRPTCCVLNPETKANDENEKTELN